MVAHKWGPDERTSKTIFYSYIILHKAIITTSEKVNGKIDLYELKK